MFFSKTYFFVILNIFRNLYRICLKIFKLSKPITTFEKVYKIKILYWRPIFFYSKHFKNLRIQKKKHLGMQFPSLSPYFLKREEIVAYR